MSYYVFNNCLRLCTIAYLTLILLLVLFYSVNFRIAEESMQVTYQGKEITLPKGVLCAASLGLASHDPDVFPDPKVFNPKRENLKAAMINFNHVGYEPTGAGTRQCPGRNISIKFASNVLIDYQKKLKKKN